MHRILSVLAAIVLMASVAAAQTTKVQPTVKGQTTKVVTHQLTGAVTKVDATSVTIHPAKGPDATFVINADTKITQGTKAMTAADIKVGDKIVVHYTTADNVNTATKIALPPPPKPVTPPAKK